MRSVRTVKSSADSTASNPSSGHSTPRSSHSHRQIDDDDDEDEDEDDDENCDEPLTTTTPVSETCLASDEFEWVHLRPRAPIYTTTLTTDENNELIPPNEVTQIPPLLEERCTAPTPPARPHHHHHRQTRNVKTPSRSKRSNDADTSSCRLSPSPCRDGHGGHGYRLSPMRSSWCCPSPPPIVPFCLHHGGGSITGMELIPYSRDCCEDVGYVPCYCLPPPGPQSFRIHDPYYWHRFTCAPNGESSSPSSPQGTYRPSSRRSRPAGMKRRDSSPSVPQYYSTTEPSLSLLLPPHTSRSSWREEWKPPLHNEDVNHLQKIQQLESDKKNLMLQVSVLTDQVDAQTEKINELESFLEQKKDKLRQAEQILQQEFQTRSAVESTKLELITEISNLRLRLTAGERDRRDSDERCRKIESELVLLHARLAEKEAELASLRTKIGQNGTIAAVSDKNSEAERLRMTLESVMASNEEKDRKIEDLRFALAKYKKLQDYVFSGHTRKASDSSAKDTLFIERIPSQEFVLPPSPGNESLKQSQKDQHLTDKPPQVPRSQLPSTSTPVQTEPSLFSWRESAVSRCSPTSTGSMSPSFKNSSSVHKSNSVENVCPSSPKTPEVKSQYGTIPRQTGPQVLQQLQEQLQRHEAEARLIAVTNSLSTEGPSSVPTPISSPELREPQEPQKPQNEPIHPIRSKSSGVSFGKGFFKLRSGKRSTSAPELAQEECVAIPLTEKDKSCTISTTQATIQPIFTKPDKDKNKGFMKFFSKWKRGSQNTERMEGNFKRGGVRATAGPRLGWSRDISSEPDIPFPRWDADILVEWLHKIGLSMYISDCKRWACNGEQMLKASPHELEKELGLKNSLHKKKLILALQDMNSESVGLPASINNLDYQWVVRWLDDVGLPQYKDMFAEARVDGRVLHHLTVEDLLNLKVTNQLHHISIKRGIQVLREKNFDPHCLIRRSLPEESKVYTPELVALWTNHRVMEWLRTVDLSEYAPNLRGSGVHGALIVYEPKFNTDLFASVLNIPPTKTLLRRHLTTHFKHIVGTELIQCKRDLETEQSYIPLTPNAKIKAVRRGQFALKKKRHKYDAEYEEYVCPMDIPVGSAVKADGERLVVRRNSDPAPQEKKLLDLQEEKTAEEIGAVSKEITSLTTMLQDEKLLSNIETTNV